MNESLQTVTRDTLKRLEQYLDQVFSSLNIDITFTRHFFDRVNDPRNRTPITYQELLRLFTETYRKYGQKLSNINSDIEAVLKDIQTDINVPFVLQWNNRARELELVAKTVMRKRNFRTSNSVLKIESFKRFCNRTSGGKVDTHA